MNRTRTLCSALVALALGADLAAAQDSRVRIAVKDDIGTAVAYALVTLGNGRPVIADSLGVVDFKAKSDDSVRVLVRRIGFKEFVGWTRRGEGSVYPVTLPRIAATLEAVTISASRNTQLEQRGFYDRVDRVRNGAIVGEFITPEELELRGAPSVSRILGGSQYARIGYTTPRGRGRLAVIQGRGGCMMTILLDGQKVSGTLQDNEEMSETPSSIMSGGTRSGGGGGGDSIDDVVNGLSIAAIEVYPSTANAPFELQRLAGRGSCGIVAIWTGARR